MPRLRLIRYFGMYSSKSGGKWHAWGHVTKHAPDGWKEQNGMVVSENVPKIEKICDVDNNLHKKSKASWARLIAKIYEIDPLTCPKCSSEMRVVAIITFEYKVKKYCNTLLKPGRVLQGLMKAI